MHDRDLTEAICTYKYNETLFIYYSPQLLEAVPVNASGETASELIIVRIVFYLPIKFLFI